MDKVKQLADELYNQKVLDGWKNVSMETCLKRATDYYRMDEVVKKLTIPAISNLLCGFFDPDNKSSSATKCKCGREKWEHPKPRN